MDRVGWLVAVLLGVLVLSAGAAALLAYADHKGGTYTTCAVDVERAEGAETTFGLPPSLLREHPPLAEALAGARERSRAFAAIGCDERRTLSDALADAGAPRPAGPGPDAFLVRHDGEPFLVTLSVEPA